MGSLFQRGGSSGGKRATAFIYLFEVGGAEPAAEGAAAAGASAGAAAAEGRGGGAAGPFLVTGLPADVRCVRLAVFRGHKKLGASEAVRGEGGWGVGGGRMGVGGWGVARASRGQAARRGEARPRRASVSMRAASQPRLSTLPGLLLVQPRRQHTSHTLHPHPRYPPSPATATATATATRPTRSRAACRAAPRSCTASTSARGCTATRPHPWPTHSAPRCGAWPGVGGTEFPAPHPIHVATCATLHLCPLDPLNAVPSRLQTADTPRLSLRYVFLVLFNTPR